MYIYILFLYTYFFYVHIFTRRVCGRGFEKIGSLRCTPDPYTPSKERALHPKKRALHPKKRALHPKSSTSGEKSPTRQKGPYIQRKEKSIASRSKETQ